MEEISEFDQEFRGQLLYVSNNKIEKDLLKKLKKYCDERPDKLGPPTKLVARYSYIGDEKTEEKKGQDLLYEFIRIVTGKTFKKGNYFVFNCSDLTIILLACPTDDQPGKGVIITSASSKVNDYEAFETKLACNGIGFQRYFKKFMTETVNVKYATENKETREKNIWSFELSVTLVFEIARRLADGDAHKNIPVSSCISACLLIFGKHKMISGDKNEIMKKLFLLFESEQETVKEENEKRQNVAKEIIDAYVKDSKKLQEEMKKLKEYITLHFNPSFVPTTDLQNPKISNDNQ